MMLRSLRMVLTAAFLMSAAAPAFAGGAGSASTTAVRIKNVGAQSVGVNAKSGVVAPAGMQSGGMVLAANGVAQFRVRRGTFTAAASNPDNLAINNVRQFATRNFKTVYLEAQQDGTAATLVGAPAGVKF